MITDNQARKLMKYLHEKRTLGVAASNLIAAAKKPSVVIGEQNIWAIHENLTSGSFQQPP